MPSYRLRCASVVEAATGSSSRDSGQWMGFLIEDVERRPRLGSSLDRLRLGRVGGVERLFVGESKELFPGDSSHREWLDTVREAPICCS